MNDLLLKKEEELILTTLGMSEEFAENKHVEYISNLYDLFKNCKHYPTRKVIGEFIIRYYQFVPRPENEYFLPIEGRDYAQISNYARIRFVADWRKYKAGDFYKPCINNGGYVTVFNGQTLHGLVAKTFNGECPEGKEIDHINDVRCDARSKNIQYLTRSENQLKNGRKKNSKKYNRCPVEQYTLDRKFVAVYPSARQAQIVNGWPKGDSGGICYAAEHGTPLKGFFWERKNNC